MPDLAVLVQAHEDLYDAFTVLAGELDDADWERPTGCPGWSVRDVVAHVVGLEAVHAGDPQPDVDLPDGLDHVTNDVGRVMEVHVEARRHVTVAELRREMAEVFARRRDWLAGLTDLGAEVPSIVGGTVPLYRFLPIRVFDLYAHDQDVRRAVGRPGDEAGPAAATSADRIAKAYAALLPTRVTGQGSVVFDVSGPEGGTLAIDLDGGRLEDAPASPDVRIGLSFPEHVAIACGRSDAPTLDDLEVEGDRDLAAEVLAACAITP